MFSRPDFLLIDSEKKPIAMVRIDGPVHDKRAQRIFDRFQAQSFLDLGIKVFVFRNEWLFGCQRSVNKKLKKWVPIQLPNFIYTALALVVVLCCKNDDTYRKYLSDKEVQQYLGIKI